MAARKAPSRGRWDRQAASSCAGRSSSLNFPSQLSIVTLLFVLQPDTLSMPGKSSSSGASALILGLGVTVVFSLSFLFYQFVWKKPKNNLISSPPSSSDASPGSSREELAEGQERTADPSVPSSSSSAEEKKQQTEKATGSSSVVVDDEESDEEDENDEASREALKTAYDDAIRLAKKLLSGEKYSKAAEKFTEAIRIAGELGGPAANDITTLYNNRSAMYEKCGDLESSLSDIGVVLAMEALHLKARVRRARIYEVQHKIKESCIDYMIGMLIEMTKGQQPSHQEKIEALVKIQAVSEAQATVDNIRNSESRELPSKSHCRNYFETFPSYHRWVALYAGVEADRDTLLQNVKSSGGEFSNDVEFVLGDDLISRLSAHYTLACFDIANGRFNSAFTIIGKAFSFLDANRSKVEEGDESLKSLVSEIYTIHGTYFHLRANFKQARSLFQHSLQLNPLPGGYETALRIASLHIEVDNLEDATKVFDSIDESLQSESDGDRAWLHVHRMSEWVTRDSEGKYRSGALEKATSNITTALELTSDFGSDSVKKSCRLMALLKMVQLLSQTKMQMGIHIDNDDLAKQKECITEATALSPEHDSVQMLNADLLSQEGRFDEALKSCDKMISSSSNFGGDALLTVIKANVICQKGMAKYAEAQQYQSQALGAEAEALLKEGQELYAEAIKTEPNCVEALIQLAQLKSMMGASEMEESFSLCKQALQYARSRDEALDILQLKLMLENRLVAIKEMRANGMQV